MKKMAENARRLHFLAAALACLAVPCAWAAGNIDTNKNFAWSENAGWINFAPTNGGVTLQSDGQFAGYAWSETFGWIHLNGSPTYGVRTTAALWAGTCVLVW